MITIRGNKLVLQPLGLFDMSKVLDSLLALKNCSPPEEMLRPEMRVHLLTVIAASVRKHVPDASLEEIEESLDMATIGPVLLALSGQSLAHTHQEIGHV